MVVCLSYLASCVSFSFASSLFFFFFFQAEDGIRDHCVTGVQTCALPISVRNVVQPAVRVVADPTRPVSLLIWIYALAMLAFNALPPIFSLYLHDRFGITADQIGFFFMIFGAVGVLMRIGPVGWFNARLGEVRTMQVGILLLFAGFVLVPLATSLPPFIGAPVLLQLGPALL